MNDEVLKRVDALAAKLGVASTQIWAVLIRQARVEITTDVIFIVFAVCLGCFFWWFCVQTMRKIEKIPLYCGMREGADGLYAANVASGILLLVCLVVVTLCLNELPTLIANPDYWALQQVLRALK